MVEEENGSETLQGQEQGMDKYSLEEATPKKNTKHGRKLDRIDRAVKAQEGKIRDFLQGPDTDCNMYGH